jgi:hypothetical protein
MICKRCECPITKKTRRVIVREFHYLRKVKAVYCGAVDNALLHARKIFQS